MPVNNQQYRGEIGVLSNKLRAIKCYHKFLDYYKSFPARTLDLGSLLMVLNLLASFHFESLAYCVVNILQCIRKVNFCAVSFSYIFSSVSFQLHICFSNLICVYRSPSQTWKNLRPS